MLKFLGIGAQKCGTTWLHGNLSRHPDVGFPGGKEVHFWDAYQHRGMDWYATLFSDSRSHKPVQGDITPAYGFLPVETIRQVHAFCSGCALVYLIRNPLERAWSSARMALKRAEMQHHEASDQWFIDHFRSQGSLQRGDYETCIRNWHSVFGAQQLQIIRFDQIQQQPVQTINAVLDHIGASGMRFAASDAALLSSKVFEGDGMPIRPSLLPVLHQIYDDRIHSLSDYLGEDFSAWLE
jgi:hypothetical protein